MTHALIRVVALSRAASTRWFLGSVVGLLCLWQLASALEWINPLFYSSPAQVGKLAWAEMQLERFWVAVGESAQAFSIGLVLAAVVGVSLGLALGWWRRVYYFLSGWVDGLNATPRVALLPLVILAIGVGMQSTIAIVFLGAFFAILINTIDGVRTVDAKWRRVGESYGASRLRMFTSVVLPASVPFIFAGMRLAVGRALIGVIVGEFFGGGAGIGYMIRLAGLNLQSDRVIFGALIFILAGGIAFGAVSLLERRFLHRWRPNVITR